MNFSRIFDMEPYDMRWEIIAISKADAWYSQRRIFIGRKGLLGSDATYHGNGWYAGSFWFDGDKPKKETIFYKVRLKKVENERRRNS